MSPTPKELRYPGPLTLGDHSAGVRRVQEWLTLAGYPVDLDGALGLATAGALDAFLGTSGLPVGLPLTERAWEALVAPLRRATVPVLAPGASLREVVVAVAHQHLAEHPREVGGPNGGPWARFYTDGHEGVAWPWCGGFVRAVLRQAAASLGAPVPGWVSLSVATSVQLARQLGAFVEGEGASVRPGDVFVRRGGPRGWDHTGIVIEAHQDHLVTAEGNTNAEGGREGTEARVRARGWRGMDFVRVE